MNAWRQVAIGDIVEITSGGTPRKSEQRFWGGEIPWISGASMHALKAQASDRMVTEAAIGNGTRLAPVGSSLILVRGMSLLEEIRVGHVVRPVAFNQDVKALTPKESVNPWFLTYLLLSRRDALLNAVHQAGHGTGVLSTERLTGLEVSLPPLDEQRRIAEVLGALDDLIDMNERLKSDLDELARTTFLRAWDGETWTTVAELGEVIMGQSPPGDTYSEDPVGMPFHQGVRDFGARFPTSRIYCSAPTRIAEAGDILIAVRAPVGEMNVAPERLAIGRGLAALRATRPSTALQAIRAFESTWSAHQGTGTVFSSINGKDLRAAKVPLVGDDLVEAALAELDNAYAELDREGAELRRTRDELLPLLMSGAVRVRPEGVAA